MSTPLHDTDREQIAKLWQEAVEPVMPPQEASVGQALAFGVNFRIHVGKAFQAAWKTSKALALAGAAVHGPFSAILWVGVAVEAYGAVTAVFASLVQRMRPIDYVTCAVLAAHPEGRTSDELRADVETFLNNPESVQLGWYLGIDEARLSRAKEVLTAPDWFKKVLETLRTGGFLDEAKDKLRFRSRHVTIGWKDE